MTFQQAFKYPFSLVTLSNEAYIPLAENMLKSAEINGHFRKGLITVYCTDDKSYNHFKSKGYQVRKSKYENCSELAQPAGTLNFSLIARNIIPAILDELKNSKCVVWCDADSYIEKFFIGVLRENLVDYNNVITLDGGPERLFSSGFMMLNPEKEIIDLMEKAQSILEKRIENNYILKYPVSTCMADAYFELTDNGKDDDMAKKIGLLPLPSNSFVGGYFLENNRYDDSHKFVVHTDSEPDQHDGADFKIALLKRKSCWMCDKEKSLT